MKKLWKIFFVICLAMMMGMPSVLAANQSYSFETGNTGQTYNAITYAYCPKINAGEAWVNRVEGIAFTDTNAYTSLTLGMAFTPSKTTRHWMNALPMWVKYSGRYYGGWSAQWLGGASSATMGVPGSTGQYLLNARIDDLLTGLAWAAGVWNSDST